MTIQHTPTLDLAHLREQVTGDVLTPDDDGYDDARRLAYGGLDPRPAVIVRVRDADDVRAALAFARETGLEVAVRSGGHSSVGYGTSAGGLVVDVRGLTGLEVDPVRRVAWAGAGVTTGEYTAAVAPHGLATGFGDMGTVGLSGITLSGGVGLLARKHGLTIDSLLAAEVVTADGRVLTVDAEHHPDLFWGLRGGGGNLGVVTRLQLRLHDVRSFLGGLLVLPATAPVVAGVVDLALRAPRELTVIASVMPCPPMPFLPPEAHGRPVVLATVAWAGDPDEGRRVVDGLRALGTPVADLVAPQPYAALFPQMPAPPDPAPSALGRTLLRDSVDEATAGQVLDWIAASPGPMRVVQVRVLGGAVADVPPDATAYAHRDAPMMLNVASMYTDPGDRAAVHVAVTAMADRLRQGRPGAYVAFLGDEGPDGVRAAYPGGTWDRLAALKRRYDPENVFHLNQNVPPA
ncbi:FAD-binding oxidoreductase [Cellulomonas aerilata]|uniref:FAD-linked oxidase n=1 Tax=Cellulomonas aerilata TaxID=515326 RepID=A0A512DE60_9CELL|nr:FAD-binding oxidoreductase [Cellulomonas aerilata]GEO34748.1 FAD-linked oxidase [Cellulomonas aerilata]